MCDDAAKTSWMGGYAPIGTVCVPSTWSWHFQGGAGYDFGANTKVNAYKMCLVEHEHDNARYGRVSTYKI